jgi:GNAT superfamily N-acetyltransferase
MLTPEERDTHPQPDAEREPETQPDQTEPLEAPQYVSRYRPEERDATEVWRVEAIQAGDVLGSVRLRRQTECVAIGFAYGLGVCEEHRRKGVARQLMLALECTALKQGITLLVSTIRADNPASASLVLSLGWIERETFRNPKSGADVRLFTKGLQT